MPHRGDNLFGLVFITLFLAPLFFSPIFTDSYESPRLIISLILIGACLVVFVFRKLLQIRMTIAMAIGLLGFLILQLVSLIWSTDVYISINGLYARGSSSIIFTISWVVFVFLLSFINSSDKVLSLFRLFVTSGTMVAILGVLHSFQIGFYAGLNPYREVVPGFIGNQNFSAMFLVGILPLLVPLIHNCTNLYRRLAYGAAGLVMIWAVMIFASRGAILAFFAASLIGLAFLLIKRFSWQWIVGVTLAIIFSSLMMFAFYSTTRHPEADTSLNLKTDPSTNSRIELWLDSIDLIKQKPLVGFGPGNFFIGFNGLGTTTIPTSERFDDAHNLFLQIATSVGLPALLFFILILTIAFQNSFKNFWKNNSLISWAVFLALLGLFISFCFSPVNLSNWMLMGFFLAGSLYDQTAKTITLNVWVKYSLFILGVVLVLCGGLYLGSEYFTTKAQDTYIEKQYEQSLKYAKLSESLNPFNTFPKVYIAGNLIRLHENPDSVREKIKSVIKHHPNLSDNYETAGGLSLMLYHYSQDQRDLDAMKMYLEKAKDLKPNSPQTLTNVAYIYYESGNKELAEQNIKNALTIPSQKNYYMDYLFLAQLHLEKGELVQMRTSLGRAYVLEKNKTIKSLMNLYDSGKFDLKKLPVFFLPVDII